MLFPYQESLPSRMFYVLRDGSSVVRITLESEAEDLSRQERLRYKNATKFKTFSVFV